MVVLAAGVSVVVHVVLGTLLWKRPAELVIPHEPVDVEVIRLAAVIAPAPLPEARVVAAPPERSRGAVAPTRHPEASRGAADPPAATPSDDAPSEPGPEEPHPPPALGTKESALPPGTPDSPAPALDTAALSRRLQSVALRCYPAAAKRFRQTGEAHVRFCVDAAGALSESKVTQTAGSELLDHAATDCVIPGAAPFGPEAFDRCFTVPVRFSP